MGNIKLSDDLFFKDVLFVPEFKLNLISVTSLTHAKTISMKFYHDFASIKHIQTKLMIGKGKVQVELYVLQEDFFTIFPSAMTIRDNVVVSCHKWHQCFGHPSTNKLKMVDQILASNKDLYYIPCSICPLAKQKKLSFPSLNNIKSKPFDLVKL